MQAARITTAYKLHLFMRSHNILIYTPVSAWVYLLSEDSSNLYLYDTVSYTGIYIEVYILSEMHAEGNSIIKCTIACQ